MTDDELTALAEVSYRAFAAYFSSHGLLPRMKWSEISPDAQAAWAESVKAAWAEFSRYDSAPLMVRIIYDDQGPELVCDAASERTTATGKKIPWPCETSVYGNTLGEIRQSLAEHLRHCLHGGGSE